jgi:hypothetical protein
MTKHRVREQLAELMEWNPAITRKAFIAKTERDGEWRELNAAQQVPYRFLADAVRAAPKSRSK